MRRSNSEAEHAVKRRQPTRCETGMCAFSADGELLSLRTGQVPEGHIYDMRRACRIDVLAGLVRRTDVYPPLSEARSGERVYYVQDESAWFNSRSWEDLR